MNQTHFQSNSGIIKNKSLNKINNSELSKNNNLAKTKIDIIYHKDKISNINQNKNNQTKIYNSIEESKVKDNDVNIIKDNSIDKINYIIQPNTSHKISILKIYNKNNTVKISKKRKNLNMIIARKSIIKNGKIIYDIDLNIDTEDNINKEEKNIYSKSNIFNLKNNRSLSNKNLYHIKKQTKNNKKDLNHNKTNKFNNSDCKIIKINKKDYIPKIDYMKSTTFPPIYYSQSSKNIYNVQNQNNINNNISDKDISNIYQSREFRYNPSQGTYSEIITDKLVQRTQKNEQLNNNQKQSKHIYSHISPDKTVQSFHQIKGENNTQNENTNSLLKIMSGNTIESLYQNTEIKNKINNNLIILDTSEKINSGLSILEENNQLYNKPNKFIISKIIPCETIVSIYENPNSTLYKNQNPLLQLDPCETVQSIYEPHQSYYKTNESNLK